MLAARLERAERYQDALGHHAGEALVLPEPSRDRVWYRYAVRTQLPAAEVVRRMAKERVHAAQPVTDWRPAPAIGAPVADDAYRRLVSLPLYPTLTDDEQARVVRALVAACRA